MMCPITDTDRRFAFHLPVPLGSGLTGFVMVEQLKSVDYIQRSAEYAGKVAREFLLEVAVILEACIEDEDS